MIVLKPTKYMPKRRWPFDDYEPENCINEIVIRMGPDTLSTNEEETSFKAETEDSEHRPTEKCDICHESFTDLITHVRTHFYEKPYLCKSCNTSFKTKPELSLHQKDCTPPKFLHQCGVCQNTACRHPSHSKCFSKRLYSCDVCGKSFCYFSQWNMHTHSCNGAKSFKCQSCKKCYRFSSTLRIHESYCGAVSEDSFHCTDCNINFDQRVDFVTHMVSKHGPGKT